ncbi:MAG: sporulation protein YqfD, partial [Agathobaculum butyriciproducens]
HARGTVQAYTTHTVRAARPLTEQSKRYTGKIRHQYALVMGNKRLNFYIGSGITGGTCDKIVTTRHFWLSDSVVLPVALVTQTYTFYEREPTTRTAEDVRVDMLSRALGETAADIDGMVTSHSETLTEQNGAAVLYLTVHAEEQIGTEAVDDSTIPEENVEMEQVP